MDFTQSHTSALFPSLKLHDPKAWQAAKRMCMSLIGDCLGRCTRPGIHSTVKHLLGGMKYSARHSGLWIFTDAATAGDARVFICNNDKRVRVFKLRGMEPVTEIW